MGKDELKAWIIPRATKPLPCFSIDVRADPQTRTQATESVTGRRPSRRRLGVGLRQQWQQQWAATAAATSIMCLEKKNRVLQWGRAATPGEGRYGEDWKWHGGGSEWR